MKTRMQSALAIRLTRRMFWAVAHLEQSIEFFTKRRGKSELAKLSVKRRSQTRRDLEMKSKF